MSVELYRQGKLAESLVEALDVLVEEGKIPGPLALKVMEEASGGGGALNTARPRLPGPHRRTCEPPERLLSLPATSLFGGLRLGRVGRRGGR